MTLPAICDPHCLNGGVCAKPGICACMVNYVGARCDFNRAGKLVLDLDTYLTLS